MFANSVASDTCHLANLHVRVLTGFCQFNGEIEAFSFTELFLALIDGRANQLFNLGCLQGMAAAQRVNAAFNVGKRLSLEASSQNLDPRLECFLIVTEEAFDRYTNGCGIWRVEFDNHIEAPPERGVDQFRVVSGCQQ